MTTPNPDLTIKKKKFTHEYLQGCIRLFYTDCGRFKYFEEASKCHAFLVTSDGENAPNFFVEQIYLGLIGVLPDKPYVWEMLPKDYPFIYRSKDEAYMWLAQIAGNYEHYRQQLEPYRQFIKEKYQKELTFKRNVDFVRELAFGYADKNIREAPNKLITEIVREVLLEFDRPFAFDAFIQIVNKRLFLKARTGRPEQIQHRQATLSDIRYALMAEGYEDTCESEQPVFRKLQESMV